MAYYLLVDIEIIDPQQFDQYRSAVGSVVEQFGGRYLVRGAVGDALEGTYNENPLVVLEFPSKEKARTFWGSPEYTKVKKLREGAARLNVVGVEGV